MKTKLVLLGLLLAVFLGLTTQAAPTPGNVLAAPVVMPADPIGARILALPWGENVIPNDTITALSFNMATVDMAGFWSPMRPTLLTAINPGTYVAGGAVSFEAATLTTSGRVWLAVRQRAKETLPTIAGESLQPFEFTYLGASEAHVRPGEPLTLQVTTGMFHLGVYDSIEIVVYHTLGGVKKAAYASLQAEQLCNAWIWRVGD